MVEGRWAVALYPFVAGDSPQWGAYPTTAERRAVVELLATLHQTGGSARAHALQEDFAIPHRNHLSALSAAWTEGPYAEPARQLVDRHAARLDDGFVRYDRLAGAAADHPELMVLC